MMLDCLGDDHRLVDNEAVMPNILAIRWVNR